MVAPAGAAVAPTLRQAIFAVLLIEIQAQLSQELVGELRKFFAQPPWVGRVEVVEVAAVCSDVDVILCLRAADDADLGRALIALMTHKFTWRGRGRNESRQPYGIRPYILRPDDEAAEEFEAPRPISGPEANAAMDAFVLVDLDVPPESEDAVAVALDEIRDNVERLFGPGNDIIRYAAPIEKRGRAFLRVRAEHKRAFDRVVLAGIQGCPRAVVLSTRSYVFLHDSDEAAEARPAFEGDEEALLIGIWRALHPAPNRNITFTEIRDAVNIPAATLHRRMEAIKARMDAIRDAHGVPLVAIHLAGKRMTGIAYTLEGIKWCERRAAAEPDATP